jgi:glycosyltransferase involved in cell wall biosynthesis
MHYLSAMVQSIDRQTRGDFEILVLDNASQPEAAARLTEWASRDPRVRVLRCETRIPMFANFNRGVAASSCEYLAFCHDDDCLQPDFIARHLAFMDAHPSVGFAGSNYDVINEAGAVTGKGDLVRDTGLWMGRDYILTLMRSVYNPLIMQSMFFRTSALRVYGFDESLSPHFGDFVVLMRMAETYDVGHLVESLVQVRQHGEQTSASMPFSTAGAVRARLLEAYAEEYAARWPEDADRARAMKAAHRRALRGSLLRGWLEPRSDEEAQSCRDALGESLVDRALYVALRGIERLGVSPQHRRRIANRARQLRRSFRELVDRP